MPEPDSAAAKTARISSAEVNHMPEITDTYLRRQLENRRNTLNAAISSGAAPAPCCEILQEVDSAIERMDRGAYGICEVCHDPVEQERLIADPLVRLCLDHLSAEEQRALERDLELASQIQRGLLPPKSAHVGDWRVHYHYKPAGLVSGDYCDLIWPAGDDGRLIFLLGDVAGKGVAASLLMTHLHAMFRSLAGAGLELDKLFEVANRVFRESTFAGQYATLICGRAGNSGELEFVSAGHPPALHLTKDGVHEIAATGLPLGMFSKSPYAVRRIRLDPGDSLVIFTDGISETRNAGGVEYGVNRLRSATERKHGSLPEDLISACVADYQAFASGMRQSDDQTLMAVHRAN
ncbi:MAG: SpoIIE family protein phosphatase [Candidatus Acidiferrales bacterium]